MSVEKTALGMNKPKPVPEGLRQKVWGAKPRKRKLPTKRGK